MSKTKDILDQLVIRLSAITIANGYQTDAGKNIHLGNSQLDSDQDDFPAINIVVEEETPEKLTINRYRCFLLFVIEGYAIDETTATVTALEMKDDINEALEDTSDVTLNGLANMIDYGGTEAPEESENGLSAAVRLSYLIEYDRGYGST